MATRQPDLQVLTGATRRRLVLLNAETLASGGEGTVYLPGSYPDHAAKIYHSPASDIQAKLRLMIDNPPRVPPGEEGRIAIAWPEELLLDPARPSSAVGFLMARVSGEPVIQYYSPGRRRSVAPFFTCEHLLATARNIARAVEICHGQRYVIGDINESNVLVSETGAVALIDTDSFQVLDRASGQIHRSPVGKPEYTPAELQGHRFDSIDRTQDHDIFGLAVIIYQLLMEGVHPFTGVYTLSGDPPQLEDRIANGHFPHSRTRAVPYSHSPLAPLWQTLHPSLQDLFIQCFDIGHDSPETRPTAHEWAQTLEEAQADLVTCARSGQHRYSSHLADCPWCERAAAMGGFDYSFPPLPSGVTATQPSFRPVRAPAPATSPPSPPPTSGSRPPPTSAATPAPASSPTPAPAPAPPPRPPAAMRTYTTSYVRFTQPFRQYSLIALLKGISIGIMLLLVGMKIGAPTGAFIGSGGLIAFTFMVVSESLVLLSVFSILLVIRFIFWILPQRIASSSSKNIFGSVGITILALGLIVWTCLSLFDIISLSDTGELFTRNDAIVTGFLDWTRIVILAIVGIAITSFTGLIAHGLDDEESALRSFSIGICLVPICIILALIAAIVIITIVAIIVLIGAMIFGLITWFF